METFLTAEWRRLLMLNYVVDPDLLKPCVPAGTELDEWRGRTYLSVVGFSFLHTRIRGWRVPWHQRFCEVNLRFYVRRRQAGETRRGVVFLREIVPRRAVAIIARRLYGEPYVRLPMKCDSRAADNEIPPGARVSYSWSHADRWHTVSANTKAAPAPLARESEAEFITEHYWGYTARPGGNTEYRVDHEPWLVAEAVDARLDGEVGAILGARFAAHLSARPDSAFVAAGSPVTVSTGNPIVQG